MGQGLERQQISSQYCAQNSLKPYLGKTFTGENPTMYNEDKIIIQKSSYFLLARNMQNYIAFMCVR